MHKVKNHSIADWKKKVSDGYHARLFLVGPNTLHLDAEGILRRGTEMYFSEPPESRLILVKVISPTREVAILGRDQDAFWIAKKDGVSWKTCAYWQGARKFAGMTKEGLFCNMAEIAGI